MGIRRHLAYGRYLARHKWFVTIECFRRRLFWRGIVHDLSKARPSEWIPYARYFYAPDGTPAQRRDSTGYYKPTDTGDDAFDFAWLLHQKRNRHHWQWWVLPTDSEGVKILPMREPYVTEMFCDWIGAGIAQGHGRDVTAWYAKNASKMQLHPETRKRVEDLLEEEYRR